MRYPLSRYRKFLLRCCALLAFAVCLTPVVPGQDNPEAQLATAPPPMKFVSHDEREQLSGVQDIKARTHLSLELAATRLRHAEELTTRRQFNAAAGELGTYEGLIEDALNFLGQQGKSGNKIRDLYRRLELTLRAHAPRLEAIRRETPAEYAVHVKAIAEFARNARTEALNSFYGETVIRGEAHPSNKKASNEKEPKDTSATPKSSSPDSQDKHP